MNISENIETMAAKSHECIESAKECVRTNPWCCLGVGAGILLIGLSGKKIIKNTCKKLSN